MHEVGAVREAAHRLIERVAGEPVATVIVRLGPGVDVDDAATAWREAVEGTPVAAAHVQWRRAYHLLRCPACDTDYFAAQLATCPTCAGDGRVVAETPPVTVAGWRPA